ncbi:hypothetical protein H2199_003786 [Coniosporium tulheliwenetii]|uniref:Uncharacterized protein n=1 Tax=Coniosporium tulheliwenetii TaxID=3383036 RepID=A0ACC2Z8C5_9PEZI|nr:hypothetical protein H2199_003786 [Cladosporium sp. JES 115]
MLTYWADLRTGRRSDPAWDAVCVDTPFHDPIGRWTDLRAKLECAGQVAGVNLQQKQEDNMWEPTPKKPRSKDQANLANGGGHKSAVDTPDQSSDSDRSEDYNLWALDREHQRPITKRPAALKPRGRSTASQTAPITPQTSSSRPLTNPDPSFSSQFNQEVMPQLFYRKYDNFSAGHNSTQGFVAGQYHRLDVATPFISVTGSFIWVIYQALKSEPSSQPSVALVDATAANRDGWAYSVQSIMSNLKKTGFVTGIRYKATQEWWIWAEIKAEAIVHVASLADLADDPEINQLLMLDELRSSNNLTGFRNRLQDSPRALDVEICAALGKIIALLRLDPRRHAVFISQLIRDITSGWFIFAQDIDEDDDFVSSSQDHNAQAFMDAFKNSTDQDRALWDGEEDALHRAFVHGMDLAAITMEKEKSFFERKAGRKRRSEEGHGRNSRRRRDDEDKSE